MQLPIYQKVMTAKFITEPSESDKTATSGEKRFAKTLKRCLGDNYIVWYDVPVGKKRLYPDFILVHPQQGILVLEVKDWRIETIKTLNPKDIIILKDGTEKRVRNPLEQARGYALEINNLLIEDSQLIHHSGQYKGKLIFPYNYGVVLPNITRKKFDANNLGDAIPSHFVICKDEMTESITSQTFQEKISGICLQRFSTYLSDEQITRIRGRIFEEIQIQLNSVQNPTTDVQIMDLEQEKIARNLGNGHHIIYGVAGSGKTLILLNRCIQLAKQLNKTILVVCYNIVLARQLQHTLRKRGINSNQVVVRHFHGWCKYVLRQHRIISPRRADYDNTQNFLCALEKTTSEAVENGLIPQGIYDAVLIDEAHDFAPSWLQLLAKMPDPEQKQLLILYDEAQKLYHIPRPTWSRLNIDIKGKGHSQTLRINYRNTIEVATWATTFAQKSFTETEHLDEDVPIRLTPEMSGRSGVSPKIVAKSDLDAEAEFIANGLKKLKEEGYEWGQMAVLYAFHWQGNSLFSLLSRYDIPISWLENRQDRLNYDPSLPAVKLMTIHCSKGLEFPIVAIPNVDQLKDREEQEQLVYVAMTRSTNKLVISYNVSNHSSLLIQRLRAALPKAV